MKNIPSLEEPLLAIQKLASDLRDPDGGCPWDKSQDHKSLIKCLIEEAYETVDALEKLNKNKPNTIENLKEELGDLFFQIVLHSQLASEKGHFNLNDVSRTVIQKLISRHPHVYGNTKQNKLTSDEVLKNWEKLKREEKINKNKTEMGMLSTTPKSLPALLKAYRLGEKVSRVGFDWSSLKEIEDKINEESQELRDEILKKTDLSDNSERIQEEFGDLLFVLAQYARQLKIDPEKSLQMANKKFMTRFTYMEEKLKDRLKENEDIHINEWENLWKEAKNINKTSIPIRL